MTTLPENVLVIGIGADGVAGLPDRSRNLIAQADVVVGGRRHLEMLPPSDTQTRVPWPSPLRDGLEDFLARLEGTSIVALASGDPLVSGIGTTLIEVLGTAAVEVVPAVSSVALARARMGWSAETTEVVTVVGRDPHRVARLLAPGVRLVVLSSDGRTPAEVATLLTEAGYGASTMTVLSDLGASDEARTSGVASTWGGAEVPALNVVAVELSASSGSFGLLAGLPDSAFEHDGQLTKRDLRASALSRLAPLPGQLLWDVGAGAGSVAIEWLRAHPTTRAIAVEAQDDRAERIERNAARLGVPTLQVVAEEAPTALAQLEHPDAVFVGGGATADGLLDACWEALKPTGRLVVHAVTIQTESLVAEWHAALGGELTRIQVETAEPIGSFTGWNPARAVTQWVVVKPEEPQE